MSFLAALRSSARAVPKIRSYSTAVNPATKHYLEQNAAIEHHAAETTELWRKISIYVCFPAVAVCIAWVYNAEKEHAAHLEHLKHENDGVMPEPPAFEYLNRRATTYPWGPNSLFFNPHVNKDMSQVE